MHTCHLRGYPPLSPSHWMECPRGGESGDGAAAAIVKRNMEAKRQGKLLTLSRTLRRQTAQAQTGTRDRKLSF